MTKQICHIKITRHNISPVGDKNGGILDNRGILINKTETYNHNVML